MLKILLFILLFLTALFIANKDMKKNYIEIYQKYKLFLNLSSIFVLIISIFLFGNLNTSTLIIAISLYPIGISHIIIDLIKNELPDLSNIFIAFYGALNLIYLYFCKSADVSMILNYILSGIILFAIYFILAIITGGQMGGGDIKLIGALGLFFPLKEAIPLFVIPFFIGSIIGILLLIKYYILDKRLGKDKPKTMPFGPAIIVSFAILILI